MKAQILVTLTCLLLTAACDQQRQAPRSSSGVTKTTVAVATDPTTGLTIEQKNIGDRVDTDNTPGSIKHLYVISPYSGQVIIYSTVKGKVTSSSKRLSPYTISDDVWGFPVDFDGVEKRTDEVLQDDGTYGSSVPYIYWWDSQGRYHQHFFTGGQIIHVSDNPLNVKSVILNMEVDER